MLTLPAPPAIAKLCLLINDDLLRHVAPLGWEHIGLTGDYVWADEAVPAEGALRPLREKPSLLAA